MSKPLETLIAAAVRAPSGDNTQPWKFVVDPESQRIDLHLDETRDLSPMNSGQRMARIAVGAALENMLKAADSLGWSLDLEPPREGALAALRLARCDAGNKEIDPSIAARVTNRRVYDGRPVPPQLLDELRRDTPDLAGVRTVWIHDRDRIDALARLIGRSDSLMFGESSMRRAFIENIHFDCPRNAEVEQGLSLSSLELSAAERVALRVMGRLPDWLLKLAGARRQFAAAARKLVASSSGMCVIVEPGGMAGPELLVGRAMQRAWLAMTARGLAAQPVMSLMILSNALQHGSPALIASLGREELDEVRQSMSSLLPEVGDARAAFLLRFGYADSPSGRTGRLPLSASMSAVVSTGVESKQPLLQ